MNTFETFHFQTYLKWGDGPWERELYIVFTVLQDLLSGIFPAESQESLLLLGS